MFNHRNTIDTIFTKIFIQGIEKYAYKISCETFCHTATLLIYNLKYFLTVTYCFTIIKNEGTV